MSTARLSAYRMSATPSIRWKICATPAMPTANLPYWSSSCGSRAPILSTRWTASEPRCRSFTPPSRNPSIMQRSHGSNRHHSRFGARYGADAVDLGGAGDSGRLLVPAGSAHHFHPERRRARIADRHLRSDVPAGLQPRQPFVDGADHLDGIRGGRRHRGDREHHALPGTGDAAIRCGAEGRAGNRLHRDDDEHFAGGGIHSSAADGRHRRPAVPRVRDHALRRDRHLHGGFADGHADDVRAPAAPNSTRMDGSTASPSADSTRW